MSPLPFVILFECSLFFPDMLLGTMISPIHSITRGWYWFLLPFFLLPNYLCTPQLCWSLGGMNLKWVLVQGPERPRKLVSHSFLPFQWWVLSVAGEFTLSTEVLTCGMRWCSKMKPFFLQFLCSYPKDFFCPIVFWKFIKWAPEFSQSCLCL